MSDSVTDVVSASRCNSVKTRSDPRVPRHLFRSCNMDSLFSVRSIQQTAFPNGTQEENITYPQNGFTSSFCNPDKVAAPGQENNPHRRRGCHGHHQVNNVRICRWSFPQSASLHPHRSLLACHCLSLLSFSFYTRPVAVRSALLHMNNNIWLFRQKPSDSAVSAHSSFLSSLCPAFIHFSTFPPVLWLLPWFIF